MTTLPRSEHLYPIDTEAVGRNSTTTIDSGGVCMVRVRLGVASLALAVLAANLSAADNATVKAIKQQIETLKAQERVTKKVVHDWYEGFLKRDKISEEVAAAERK